MSDVANKCESPTRASTRATDVHVRFDPMPSLSLEPRPFATRPSFKAGALRKKNRRPFGRRLRR